MGCCDQASDSGGDDCACGMTGCSRAFDDQPYCGPCCRLDCRRLTCVFFFCIMRFVALLCWPPPPGLCMAQMHYLHITCITAVPAVHIWFTAIVSWCVDSYKMRQVTHNCLTHNMRHGCAPHLWFLDIASWCMDSYKMRLATHPIHIWT